MGTDDRSQSEVIGVVLLTAVVVVLVSVIGAVVLSERLEDGETRIAVDVELEQNDDETVVTVRHRGGATVDPADVRVIIYGNDRAEFRLNAVTDPPAEQFSAPSTWRYTINHTEPGQPEQFTGVVEVLVIYEPEGTVLDESVHELER